jgi:hypothetical protein
MSLTEADYAELKNGITKYEGGHFVLDEADCRDCHCAGSISTPWQMLATPK